MTGAGGGGFLEQKNFSYIKAKAQVRSNTCLFLYTPPYIFTWFDFKLEFFFSTDPKN